MKTIAIAVFFIALCGDALAQQEIGAGMGGGLSTCAQFERAYRQYPEQTDMFYFSWAQGFMSGLNIAQHLIKQPLRNLNGWQISDQQSHIRRFCDEHPLSQVADGVRSLFFSLPIIPPQSN